MLLWKYIKQMWTTFAFFAANCGILWLVCWLYQESFEMLGYAEVLMAVLGLICCMISFVRFKREHKQREQVKRNIMLQLDQLPEPRTCVEEELVEVIDQLAKEYRDYRSEQTKKAKERQEYYTTWVHQIKNPIAAMQLQLQEEDNDYNRQLGDQLFRIEQYVDMALSFTRLGDQVSDFVFKEEAMDGILRSVIRKYASQFVRKRIRMDYEETDLKVITDKKWMTLMLEQFLSNAVKYTNEGTVTIRLSEDGILTIRDTGMGIAGEDLPRIFEKGFTGYNGHSGAKSTGIGLYLAKQTAEKLDCVLSVESEVGVGTTVFVKLPMKRWEQE